MFIISITRRVLSVMNKLQNRRTITILLVGCAVAMPWATASSLIVIHDQGGVSVAPFFAPFEDESYEDDHLIYEPTFKPDQPLKPFSESDMLPVVTESLSATLIDTAQLHQISQQLNLPDFITPFFVIGDDRLSMQWLQARLPYLVDMGAVGLIVNVTEVSALESLRAIAPGLEMRPTHGDTLKEQFLLPGYPVLISSQGIEQ